ncbi:PEPxxWA-CTERM sorting domain-containing protein [Sphingomonas sp. 1P08PE]|uniref:PEPxxWA-CTERM sorting domain-containing protein n=1 Tax=Sphingomonas sp. 1P08PE TaxID=554122 RepID=UPI0039A0C8C1
MMKTIPRLLAAATLCALPATADAAVTYDVQGGRLVGASGVVVDGSTYDVAFVDGSCATAHGTCTAANFAFTDKNHATLAAQALLDQVFLDGSAGAFDSDPALTMGCGNESGCESYVVYAAGLADGFGTFQSIAAINTATGNRTPDQIGASGSLYQTFFDTGENPAATFARFTPAGAVPEPATWALMLAGFGLTGAALRRRRVGVAQVLA